MSSSVEPTGAERSRRRLIALIALVFCVALILWRALLSGGARSKHPPGQPAVPVAAHSAREGSFPIYAAGLGTVVPLHTVTLRTRVDGELLTVAFAEGQIVKRGDFLAQIDPRPFEVQLLQGQGQLARDEALLMNARRDLLRLQKAGNAVSQQQLDTQAALVAQYEGVVKIDQGQIDNARLQLTYARITAPLSGRIGLRAVDPGNIVHATDTNGLAVISQIEPITVIFTLPQDVIPELLQRVNQPPPPEVQALARNQKRVLAAGHVLAVDNQVDPASGTVRVKAEFPNTEHQLFPNQFVNARLLLNPIPHAVIVPAAAVQRGPEGPYVFIVRPDQTVEMRRVETRASSDEEIAISKGLNGGELLVTEGADRLQDGTKVAVAQNGGPASSIENKPGAAEKSERVP